MVNLTRIYTRTGDDGTTALGDFSRTAKTDPRLQAYADTNEANSVLGIALAAGGLREDVRATLLRVQNELFDVGADLCNPLRTSYAYAPLRVRQPWVDDLEADCDRYLAELEPLRSFILPGGSGGGISPSGDDRSQASRTLHLGSAGGVWRPGGRRAGRWRGEPLTATYLNRLSDLLFVPARIANLGSGGDVLWQPGGGTRRADPARRAASLTEVRRR